MPNHVWKTLLALPKLPNQCLEDPFGPSKVAKSNFGRPFKSCQIILEVPNQHLEDPLEVWRCQIIFGGAKSNLEDPFYFGGVAKSFWRRQIKFGGPSLFLRSCQIRIGNRIVAVCFSELKYSFDCLNYTQVVSKLSIHNT